MQETYKCNGRSNLSNSNPKLELSIINFCFRGSGTVVNLSKFWLTFWTWSLCWASQVVSFSETKKNNKRQNTNRIHCLGCHLPGMNKIPKNSNWSRLKLTFQQTMMQFSWHFAALSVIMHKYHFLNIWVFFTPKLQQIIIFPHPTDTMHVFLVVLNYMYVLCIWNENDLTFHFLL